ncbi:pentapeptide repeat-containing protein [Rhodococcus chondri]|uniref:Pentapeptide repeat-containing protein n=1 Tax=Rhodococcus chondri TaxID=3065941 RepID=A0ABU7K113_9NOCA|nr:pentapeptide repeat-containing protein [Rhodococcus sp. CC-R104]MEE2035217.1 pentapeptide repeat-containing protein [Rhodococcus sp. CC-R104]
MPSSRQSRSTLPHDIRRTALRADCASCFALCCTAFGFSRSVDFAEDKSAGAPCRHLGPDFSCSIHARLQARGFRGCTVFDCFGAGQVVSQRLFAGSGPCERPETQRDMLAAFALVRQLHEMLWHLVESAERTYDPDAAQHACELVSTIHDATCGSLSALFAIDPEALHSEVRTLLVDISAEVRAGHFAAADPPDPALRSGADLAGANLRGRRLCGADLRGACLIAADLRGSDLTAVDLLGADLRDARLDGADLCGALYLTWPQIAAARISAETRLPAHFSAAYMSNPRSSTVTE